MYEENENKINWGAIIKKVGILIVAILVIFGIITLINKCSKNNEQDPSVETPVNLTEQVDALEKATLEYLSVENLPSEINASKTIRLKILINKGLIENIYDSEGNKCDINESYSEVTRLENNYAVKVSVTCGTSNAYRIIYVGCFEECNGGICKGTQESTNGICAVSPSTDKEEEKGTSTNSNSTSNSNNTSKPSTSTKPSTNNNTNTNTNTNTNNKKTLYEFKKCTTKCLVGQLDSNGDCVSYKLVTVYGTVLTIGGETKTTSTKVEAEKSVETTTVYFTDSSKAINTSTVTYEFVKYVAGKGYMYKKHTTTYKDCADGTKPVDGYCTVYTTTTTPVSYKCEDDTFIYTESTGKCSKVELQANYSSEKETTCQTIWSYSTSIPGWTRTGRTK